MKKAMVVVLIFFSVFIAQLDVAYAECKQKDPAFTYVEELGGLKGCWITHDENGEPLKKPIKVALPAFMHKILVQEMKNGIIGSEDF